LAQAGGPGDVPDPNAVPSGTYYVRVNNTDDASYFVIETIEVIIHELPDISSSTVCDGATSMLTIDVFNGIGLSFVLDGSASQKATMFDNVPNGNHLLTATDINGCVISENFLTACITNCSSSNFVPSAIEIICDGTISVLPQEGIDFTISDPSGTMVGGRFAWYTGNDPDTEAIYTSGPQTSTDDCSANAAVMLYAFIQSLDNGVMSWIQVASHTYQVFPEVSAPVIVRTDDNCNYTITPHCPADILDPAAHPLHSTVYPGGNISVVVMIGLANNPCEPETFILAIEACPWLGEGVWIPTAFSPNGDNVNDVFRILGVGIERGEIHIYDRWGQGLFHSSDINIGWDGRLEGKPAEVKVYVFWASVTMYSGETVTYQGNITLLR